MNYIDLILNNLLEFSMKYFKCYLIVLYYYVIFLGILNKFVRRKCSLAHKKRSFQLRPYTCMYVYIYMDL